VAYQPESRVVHRVADGLLRLVAHSSTDSYVPKLTLNRPNRRVRTRTHGGVTGTAGDRLPMSILLGGP